MSKFKLLALTAIAAAAIGSVPAAAMVTFANFSPTNTDNNAAYSGGSLFTAPGGVGGPAGVQVIFNILSGGLPQLQGVSATFQLNTAMAPAILPASGDFTIPSASGGFSFITNNAINLGGTLYAAGSNLLSGTFVDGYFSGTVDGSSGSLRASTGGGSTIAYTSSFLSFAGATTYDFALPITAVDPVFGPGGGTIADFAGSMGGQFSSEPGPLVGSVPEPTTWAMLVLGFGVVGVAARRRKPVSVAA